MMKTHYSVPVHPYFYDEIREGMDFFKSVRNGIRTDLVGAVLTKDEFLRLSEAGQQTHSLCNIPCPVTIHGINFDNASADVTFSDSAPGKEFAHQEEIGWVDIEKHFFAVPRYKQVLCSGIAVRITLQEMVAIDLVAREGMFRGPDRWLDHRIPISIQTDDSYTDMKLCICNEDLSAIKDYNFKGDERIVQLLASGRLKMELGSPLGIIAGVNVARAATIDPLNVVGIITNFDIDRGYVFAKVLTEVLTRLDHENNGCAELYAKLRGFGKVIDGIPKISRFVTFDLGVIKKIKRTSQLK